MKIKPLLPYFLGLCATSQAALADANQAFKLESPDQETKVNIYVGQTLQFDVYQDGVQVIEPSPISITLGSGEVWGISPQLVDEKREKVSQRIDSPFYAKSSVEENYQSLQLTFEGDWGIEFRAYNDGIAYRFISHKSGEYVIQEEQVEFNFISDATATVPYVNTPVYDSVGKSLHENFEKQLHSSFENTYTVAPLSELDKNKLMFLPLVVDAPQGKRISITESDLQDYPGLFMHAPMKAQQLKGYQAGYPASVEEHTGHNNLQTIVKTREDYIAKVNGPRSFPWRVLTVARHDIDLANSDLSYLLAAPSKIKDTSWIKPGKVAWEWWNDWNLEGVDFETGVNTETYKYYIDFASKNKIEYVILDEGWAVNKEYDLMKVVPEIDLEELIAYGKSKNVDIILWAGYYAFDRDMERVCAHYAKMGVKGFKVDFLDRDDQEMVAFHARAAETAARHKLLLDMHGTYKPSGLQRTYPHILNFEGVYGLENMKWATPEVDHVTYDVSIPFIRMTSGPMDYTQGAMINSCKGAYTPNYHKPMSQGTRAHQVAQYIIYLAPLNMMCDTPTNYEKNQSTTDFIAPIPTTWDETRVLDGKIGEYIVTLRRKGKDWYIGGLNNWDARDISLDIPALTGLSTGQIEIFKDGTNAARNAEDFTIERMPLSDAPSVIHMAPGGGFAIKITP